MDDHGAVDPDSVIVEKDEAASAINRKDADAIVAALRTETMPALVARYTQAYDAMALIAAEAEPYQVMMDAISEVWQERLTASHGTHLPSGDTRIEIKMEQGERRPVTNAPLLHTLLTEFAVQAGIPDSEVEQCARLVQPEPEWRSNLTNLKQLVKKYGDGVQKIFDRCVEYRRGMSRFRVIVHPPMEAITHERE